MSTPKERIYIESGHSELEVRLMTELMSDTRVAGSCEIPPCDESSCKNDSVALDWVDDDEPSPRCDLHRVNQ
jgi:hypothetical protein